MLCGFETLDFVAAFFFSFFLLMRKKKLFFMQFFFWTAREGEKIVWLINEVVVSIIRGRFLNFVYQAPSRLFIYIFFSLTHEDGEILKVMIEIYEGIIELEFPFVFCFVSS